MSVVAETCLAALLGSLPASHAARRNGINSDLKLIIRELQLVGKHILTQVEIDKLNIKVEQLDTSDAFPEEPYYFEQMPASKLQAHPVAGDKESQDLLAQFDDDLRKIAAGESGKSGYQIAEAFACRLLYEMSGFKREGAQERLGKTLITLTNWRYMEKFLPSVMLTDFYKIVFRNEGTRSSPVGVWYEYDKGKVPHIMMSMKHEFHWDENLLAVEVALIVSSIRSRVAATSVHQMMIPVMVFSFGARHGRILQAFFDGEGLMVHKSKLIDLVDPSTRPFDIFARFAASKPVGDTQSFPLRKPSQEGKPKRDCGVNFNVGPGEDPRLEMTVDYNALHNPQANAIYDNIRKAENNAEGSVEGNAENNAENNAEDNDA